LLKREFNLVLIWIDAFIIICKIWFMNISQFLDRVMECDPYVRFAVVIDTYGKKIDFRQKEGVTNFLPPEEMEDSIRHALHAWEFRKKISGFVGKNQFVLAVYDNVRRITLPVGVNHLLLVALDNKGGQKDLVENILAIIGEDYTKPISPGMQN
jgi:hypothetical protein